MRVWHSPWSWLNEIVPLDSVAGNTLIGMFTRLIFRKPFQVGRAAIACLLNLVTLVVRTEVQPRARKMNDVLANLVAEQPPRGAVLVPRHDQTACKVAQP